MIEKTYTFGTVLQQHASRSKGSAIRTRMLQGYITAKMVPGVRFAKLVALVNQI